jgi:hypothetical protein
MNKLVSIETAAQMIRAGAPLSLAAAEDVLDRLPRGNWIAGTIPYFMVDTGGVVVADERVFVTDLSQVGQVRIAYYAANALEGLVQHAAENGFSLVIIPSGSPAHKRFATEAANYKDAFLRPTVGWVSGIHLAQLGKETPKVYDGRTARKYEDGAVVAYVQLPRDTLASLEIINQFESDGGDVLRFAEASLEVRNCLVNGTTTNFAQYLAHRGLTDGRVPMIGDFANAPINVSLQNVDCAVGTVSLYAPVFPGVDYHFAKPLADYTKAFRERLQAQDHSDVVFSCNCILNYLFGELEGKRIGGVEGPFTFGEIAYQLLNQTLVSVRIV